MTEGMNRRDLLLKLGGAAVVGVGAAALGGAAPAEAADQPPVLMNTANSGTSTTAVVINQAGFAGLEGLNMASDSTGVYGVAPKASGITYYGGVVGDSQTGVGTVGLTGNGPAGVIGLTQAGQVGVLGYLADEGYTKPGLTERAGVYGSAVGHYGVYGLSSNSTGVVGGSISGVGVGGNSVHNAGANGHSTEFAGVAGSSNQAMGVLGDTVVSNRTPVVTGYRAGVIGRSDTAIGVIGLSADVEGVRGESASGDGVSGHTSSTGQTIPGSRPPAGVAGTGRVGVFGQGAVDGTGMLAEVVGTADTAASGTALAAVVARHVRNPFNPNDHDGPAGSATSIALTASNGGLGLGASISSASGVALRTEGGTAPILLVPALLAGAPTTGTHGAGELLVDKKGALFQCVAASAAGGDPGTWFRVGFNAINPIRICDTRPDQETDDNPYAGRTLAAHGADGDTLTVGVSGPIGNLRVGTYAPVQASAAVLNLTVVNMEAPGYLTVYPLDLDTAPLASNLNFPGKQAGLGALANSVTVRLGLFDNGTHGGIKILNGSSQPVDVIVDLAGFYS